jgi:hypothetical protein
MSKRKFLLNKTIHPDDLTDDFLDYLEALPKGWKHAWEYSNVTEHYSDQESAQILAGVNTMPAFIIALREAREALTHKSKEMIEAIIKADKAYTRGLEAGRAEINKRLEALNAAETKAQLERLERKAELAELFNYRVAEIRSEIVSYFEASDDRDYSYRYAAFDLWKNVASGYQDRRTVRLTELSKKIEGWVTWAPLSKDPTKGSFIPMEEWKHIAATTEKWKKE